MLLERLDGAGSRLNHIRVGVLARVLEGSSLVETQDKGTPLAGVLSWSVSSVLVRAPPCHGGGRGFEPRTDRLCGALTA